MSSKKSVSNTAWISGELSRLLGLPDTEDVAQYLLTMESSRDIEDYLQSMLDLSNPDHQAFVESLLRKLGHSIVDDRSPAKKKASSALPVIQFIGEMKEKPESSKAPVQNSKNKKVKQVNLFSKEGQAREAVTLPGQHRCECQASKHPLVRNCLDCGRVICSQEGSGPCIFCTENKRDKSEVKESPAVITNKKSGNKSGNRSSFLDGTAPLPDKAFTTAMAHKERLLEFDRTSEHRTRVIDDESDYFNSDGNKWLTPKQRDTLRAREQQLRDKRHGSRRAIQVTLDFAGRQVIEERDNYDELFIEPQFEEESNKEYYDQYAVNPALAFPRPVFEPIVDEGNSIKKSGKLNQESRVQDAELQKMSDPGKCLSMHQPYASLLVAGIKKHEGRSWYSSHRGRLWIASTVQQPTDEEIKELENFYRVLYNRDDIPFPTNYPTGCILGCVDVTNVLPQEEYRLEYPDGESQSAYVFVCSNPHELFIKFPNKGQHKIYKLDPAVHQTAKKSLKF